MPPGKRGPWSKVEDKELLRLIEIYGALNWVRIAAELCTRSPKQCRERYHQNLKPTLNHAPITAEEGVEINRLVEELGKRWAEIARQLNGRSDNAVKNWWNGNQNRRMRLERRLAMFPPSPATDGGGGRGVAGGVAVGVAGGVAVGVAGGVAGAGTPAAHYPYPQHHHSHPYSHSQGQARAQAQAQAQALLNNHTNDSRRPRTAPTALPPISMAHLGAGSLALRRPAEGHGQHRHFPWTQAPLPSPPCSSELAESDTGSNYTMSPAGSSRPLAQRPILPPLRDWHLSNSGRARLPSLSSLSSPPAPPIERLEARLHVPSPRSRAQLLTAPSSPMQGQGQEGQQKQQKQQQQQKKQQDKPDDSAGDRDSRMDVSSLLDS